MKIREFMDELRKQGYVVIVFSPEELHGIGREDIEDIYTQDINEYISLNNKEGF